jgi:hypothetical protein
MGVACTKIFVTSRKILHEEIHGEFFITSKRLVAFVAGVTQIVMDGEE